MLKTIQNKKKKMTKNKKRNQVNKIYMAYKYMMKNSQSLQKIC